MNEKDIEVFLRNSIKHMALILKAGGDIEIRGGANGIKILENKRKLVRQEFHKDA